MRELMEIPQNAVTMITIGALTAEKNHAVILKALSHLKMLEIHYVICGAGPKAEYLYQLTRQLNLEDKVHFTRHRDDVANLLHASDIFCLPSKQEGIGMAALEAMEAGLQHFASLYTTSSILSIVMQLLPVFFTGAVIGTKPSSADSVLSMRLLNRSIRRAVIFCIEMPP